MKIKIWEIRTQRNISLKKLSMKTGISKSALNRYENEKREISIQKLEKIAEALNCTINDLFESEYK